MICFTAFLKESGAKNFIFFLMIYHKAYHQKADSAWRHLLQKRQTNQYKQATADNLYRTVCLLFIFLYFMQSAACDYTFLPCTSQSVIRQRRLAALFLEKGNKTPICDIR